jgi:alpha-glucosidase
VPLKRADSCPGYKASNVQRSDSSLTADLKLAGTACNIYSQDLQDLKFLAEWQTGMFRLLGHEVEEQHQLTA